MSILLDNSLLLEARYATENVDTVGIFPKGHVSIVAGEPGIGKTWFMLSIAKAVAEGGFILGRPGERVKRGKSLIFAGETGVRLLASRVQLLGGIEPLSSVRVISSHVCAKMSLDTMINTSIGRKNITEAIKEYRPDVTFFDTMISFMADGKDESSQVDMGDCLRGLGSVAAECQTAIVLLHHFRKRASGSVEGGRGMDEVIGSSVLTRLSSVVVGIERKRDVRMVKCLKSWWEEFNPFSFRIIGGDVGHVSIKVDYSYDKEGGYAPSRVPSTVSEKLLRDFVGREFTVSEVSDNYNCSRSTASEALYALIRKGKARVVRKDSYTKIYALGSGQQLEMEGGVGNDDDKGTE